MELFQTIHESVTFYVLFVVRQKLIISIFNQLVNLFSRQLFPEIILSTRQLVYSSTCLLKKSLNDINNCQTVGSLAIYTTTFLGIYDNTSIL